MSQAGTNPEDAVAHSRSRRRFKWWKALAFGVVFAGAVAAGLFFERKPIAALLVQAYLLKYGIASSVEFEELSRGGFVAHVRVGPEMPEFSADILDVTLDYDGFLALPQISTVRLVRPVLRASFDGKRFSFGSLQPLVDEALAKQPEGPGPSVTVEQGTLYVATPAGLLQLAVDVSVDKGKLNRLSAALSPVHLRSASLSGEIKDARLAATVTNEKLNGTVSFQIAALSSSASPDMESKDLEGNIDITGAGWRNTNNSLDIAAVKTTLAIKSASLNNSQNSAVQPELKLAVENPRARVSNGTIDVVAPRIVAGLHLAGFQAPEIATARSDAQLVLESVQAHLTGDAGDFAAQHANMTLAVDSFKSTQAKAGNSEIRLDIDALKTSYDGRAFRGSGRAEAATEFRRFSFGPHSVNVLSFNATTNDTRWEWSDQASSLAAALHASFDARTLRYRINRDAITLTSLRGDFDGSAQGKGTDLEGRLRGSLTANAAMPRSLANALTADIPGAGADPVWAEALAEALVDFKLEIPSIEIARSAESDIVRISKPLSIAATSGAQAELSAQTDRPILHAVSDRFDGAFNANIRGGRLPEVALQVSAYRVSGKGSASTLDASTALQAKLDYGAFRNVRLSANGSVTRRDGVLTVTFPRCGDLNLGSYTTGTTKQVTDAATQICADPAGPFLQAGNAGWRVRAAWSGARAKLEQAQSQVETAGGHISLDGDANGPRSGRLEVSTAAVSDALSAVRYRPVVVSGAMALSNQEWSGTFQVTGHQHKLASVQVRHAMDSGTGSAAIEARDIAFDPMFQPADISPLLATLGSRVRGHASFSGRAAWNTKTMESSGTVHITDVDVQTPLGMARGVRSDLALTSLVPIAVAPNQTITVSRIDWPVPVEGISAQFSWSPEMIQLASVSASLAGGRVSLDPLTYSFMPGATTGGTLRLEHIDLTPLIAAAGLTDKVKITSRMGGSLPFTIGPEGLRFANGHIAAESPGRLSIQRSALTSAVGTGADGQAPPNAVQDFAYQALENLSFTELNGDVNSRPMGRLGVLFHVKGEHDPAIAMQTRVGVIELLQGHAFDKPLPLPKGTPIDLTLDTSLNLDELLSSYFGTEPQTPAAAK